MADKLAIMLLTIDPDRPHICGTPFFQAAAAAAMDVEVEVYFASRAVRLLIQGVADSIYPSDNRTKTVYGFMKDAADLGVRFYACGGAMEPCDATKEELIPETTGIAGAATFVERAMDDDWKTITY